MPVNYKKMDRQKVLGISNESQNKEKRWHRHIRAAEKAKNVS